MRAPRTLSSRHRAANAVTVSRPERETESGARVDLCLWSVRTAGQNAQVLELARLAHLEAKVMGTRTTSMRAPFFGERA